MKYLLSALLGALVLLSGCAPKVVAVVDNEYYTATFYDKKCDVPSVRENLQAQAAIALAMGMPQAEIDKIMDSFKRGDVLLKQKGEKRSFCYRSDGQNAFVIDEKGGEGVIILSPKK